MSHWYVYSLCVLSIVFVFDGNKILVLVLEMPANFHHNRTIQSMHLVQTRLESPGAVFTKPTRGSSLE